MVALSAADAYKQSVAQTENVVARQLESAQAHIEKAIMDGRYYVILIGDCVWPGTEAQLKALGYETSRDKNGHCTVSWANASGEKPKNSPWRLRSDTI
jgi:hypothetical protein